MPDKAASILARLQNKAKESGRSYQLCLQLFCQEEFLRRLEKSKYKDNLILKGGLFIYSLTKYESRPTMDIDFLMKLITNSEEEIMAVIKEILEEKSQDDYVSFEIIGVEKIALRKKYNSIGIQILAKIKNTKTPFGIDIGFGDIVLPRIEYREIPTQLEGFPRPCISTYSLESTIAEKLDAIIDMMDFTSRMKDFYDIYYLAGMFRFKSENLSMAIKATLENRKHSYDNNTLIEIRKLANNEGMNRKWNAFLKIIKENKLTFQEVVEGLFTFINPVYQAFINKQKFNATWNPENHKWQEISG